MTRFVTAHVLQTVSSKGEDLWLRKPASRKAGGEQLVASSVVTSENWLGKPVLDLMFLWHSWVISMQAKWRLYCSRQLT